MRYNANKGEITLLKAKNANVKCEITLLKAKKRESQMRNNAFKGEITRKSNALKRQTQMHYITPLNLLYLSLELSLFVYMLKLVRPLFTIDKDHVFYLMPRSFHLLLVFGYHSLDGQKNLHIHTNKFISWIPMIFT